MKPAEPSARPKATLMKDATGNTSSKRVAGLITMLSGVVIAAISSWRAPEAAAAILWPVMVSGGALLGVTVLERKL